MTQWNIRKKKLPTIICNIICHYNYKAYAKFLYGSLLLANGIDYLFIWCFILPLTQWKRTVLWKKWSKNDDKTFDYLFLPVYILYLSKANCLNTIKSCCIQYQWATIVLAKGIDGFFMQFFSQIFKKLLYNFFS